MRHNVKNAKHNYEQRDESAGQISFCIFNLDLCGRLRTLIQTTQLVLKTKPPQLPVQKRKIIRHYLCKQLRD